MADLAITDVIASPPSSRGTQRQGTSGEAFAKGQLLYLDATLRQWFKAKNDTAAHAAASAVAVTAAGGAGVTFTYQRDGDLVVDVQPVVGATYYVSANAGEFAPDADVASAHFVTVAAVGKPNKTLGLILYASGVAKP